MDLRERDGRSQLDLDPVVRLGTTSGSCSQEFLQLSPAPIASSRHWPTHFPVLPNPLYNEDNKKKQKEKEETEFWDALVATRAPWHLGCSVHHPPYSGFRYANHSNTEKANATSIIRMLGGYIRIAQDWGPANELRSWITTDIQCLENGEEGGLLHKQHCIPAIKSASQNKNSFWRNASKLVHMEI